MCGAYISRTDGRARIEATVAITPVFQGEKQWVAEITGHDATYGIARKFLKGRFKKAKVVRPITEAPTDADVYANSVIDVHYRLKGPGIYEFRNFDGGLSRPWSGFFQVNEDNTVRDLTNTKLSDIRTMVGNVIERLAILGDRVRWHGPPPP